MAPTPLVTSDDLADWLGETISSGVDQARAEWALRAASALVRGEADKTWLDADGALVEDIPDAVLTVTLACAARGYTNPRGAVDSSEGVDDYNHREQVLVEEAGFFLTASEKEQLAKATGVAQAGIGVVGTCRGDIEPLYDDEGCERLLPPWY